MPYRPVPAGAGLSAPDHLPAAVLRLLELDPKDCRWPIGEPSDAEFGFCAAPRLVRGAYCAMHRALACESRR